MLLHKLVQYTWYNKHGVQKDEVAIGGSDVCGVDSESRDNDGSGNQWRGWDGGDNRWSVDKRILWYVLNKYTTIKWDRQESLSANREPVNYLFADQNANQIPWTYV